VVPCGLCVCVFFQLALTGGSAWQGLAEDGDLEGILGLVREIKRGPSAGPEGARAEFVEQVMGTWKLDRVA